jgi:Putative DNA-binding domain
MPTKSASLAVLQREMLSAILAQQPMGAQHPHTLLAEINGGKLTPEKRLDIYQRNVTSTLSNTLVALYPVVNNIVGTAFFNEMAAQYMAVTPSRSGDLHDYGRTFADFVSTYQPANELPYLGDVAKLEWRWHLAFHAADAAQLDITRLQATPTELFGTLKFKCAPAVSLITSAYPLLQIWLFNQPDYAANADNWQIDWEIDEAYFVISRQSNTVEIRALSQAAYVFLSALRAKSSLANALDAALRHDRHDDQFDLQQTLGHFIEWQCLIDIEPDKIQ